MSGAWDSAGAAPLSVVMISFNEGHNIDAVLENLKGFAAEVFLVDSYSTDETIDKALAHGIHVVQRPFKGFGDQWNFALSELPITQPWTMKLDPDERLSDALKENIRTMVLDKTNASVGYHVDIRLWFMKKPLPVRLNLLRLWQTGRARMSDVSVNEHILVDGDTSHVQGDIEHHDSPHLHHWLDKQNHYTTKEAEAFFNGTKLSVTPKLFGTALERRMWLKNNRRHVPFRQSLMFLYCWLYLGAWRAGKEGFIWARLRSFVFRMIDDKLCEMQTYGDTYTLPPRPRGHADERVRQYP